VAYALAVTGSVAHGCDCLAGQKGNPICKHRAAFYAHIGALSQPTLQDRLLEEDEGRDFAALVTPVSPIIGEKEF
jgi:uncharacterized Zn finger protein